jgi:hypothetical protein
MKRRCAAFAGAALVAAVVLAPGLLGRAEEPADSQVAVLAGERKIVYTHDAVRVYSIDTDGKVSFDEEKLKGQIKRKGSALLLQFDGDDRIERLTLGTDGRLFVEHFNPKSDFPDGKAKHMGIGVRQKEGPRERERSRTSGRIRPVSPGAMDAGSVGYPAPYLTRPSLKLASGTRKYEVPAETELVFFRVMRWHRQGQVGEGNKALAAVIREAEVVEADGAAEWVERVELRLLREVAEKLIGLPKP